MIILGDSLQELPKLGEGSHDLIITSPPYKDKDGFSYPWITKILKEIYRVQADDSLFFLNFGHLVEDKMRPFRVAQIAIDQGYKLNDTIIWVKNHYKPIQGNRRLNNLTEFIFMFYKGEMPLINRLAIGIPYVDKSNAGRFNEGLDLHCGGNVWYIDYETINSSEQKLHNDRYPPELPERCIKLCGYDVKNILDPFNGSGTTGLIAKQFGKNYIGIEKDVGNYETSLERLGIFKMLPGIISPMAA